MKVHIPFMSSIGLCSTLPCGIAKRALDICPLVLSRRLTGPGGAAKTERINVSNKRVVLIQACRTVGIHAQPLSRLRRFCGSITNVLEVLGPNRRKLTTSGRTFRPSTHCACCTYLPIDSNFPYGSSLPYNHITAKLVSASNAGWDDW